MATKKTTRRTRRKYEDDEELEPAISPETRRGITIVVFFVLAILVVLSLVGIAGGLGRVLDTIVSSLFGWGRYIVPALLLFLGIILLVPDRVPMRAPSIIGFLAFVFAGAGTLHLFIPLDEALVAVPEGRGGGYVGIVLSLPLQKMMGFWATLVILAALVIVGVLLLFNTSLEHLLRRRGLSAGPLGRLLGFFQRPLEDGENDEADDDIGEEPDEETDEDESDENGTPRRSFAKKLLSKRDTSDLPAQRPVTAKGTRKIDMPIDLLERKNSKPRSGDIRAQSEVIERTLKHFGVDVEMGEVRVGPTVTQYTLRPAEGVKLSKITSLSNDLALALAAHPIRIEAPIPGKSLVGIEVPNESIAIVGLRELLESKEFTHRKSNLTFPVGKDVSGSPMMANIDTMPHLLIAGATGSGKSVAINTLIIALLYQNSPDILKFILVDPKKVELTAYNDIPHLLTPVITDVDKTINALKWVVGEMDRRYRLLEEAKKKNIQQYNAAVLMKLPYIVVVIDELADLMSIAAQDVERIIIRLAQMARAVGIHLVLSTQRPSVDVITGLIKANITSRIAFSVASLTDSRTILDYAGAEKLLGRGDMLFTSAELSKPRRLQGALVTEEEIDHVVSHVCKQTDPEYIEDITSRQTVASLDTGGDYDEEKLDEAKEVIWEAQKASASLLQRRLSVGYARAARILDLLEEQGIIGPGEGAKPREILVQKEDLVSAQEEDEQERGESDDYDEPEENVDEPDSEEDAAEDELADDEGDSDTEEPEDEDGEDDENKDDLPDDRTIA